MQWPLTYDPARGNFNLTNLYELPVTYGLPNTQIGKDKGIEFVVEAKTGITFSYNITRKVAVEVDLSQYPFPSLGSFGVQSFMVMDHNEVMKLGENYILSTFSVDTTA